MVRARSIDHLRSLQERFDASLIYAYRKTGRIVTEQNAHLLNDEDRLEWNAALDEYKRLSKSQRG